MLVKDTPVYRLRPPVADSPEAGVIQLYSTVFMISGTVERIPEALAGYLDDPGPDERFALRLARKLLADNGGDLSAAGRGGTFLVHMQLNESGRAKLTDAVQNHDLHGPEILLTKFSRNSREYSRRAEGHSP